MSDKPKRALIPLTQFAQHMGCSEGAVRKAINAGKISSVKKDIDGRNLGVYWERAELEWNDNYDPGTNGSSVLSSKLGHSDSEVETDVDGNIRPLAKSKQAEAHYKAELARVELEKQQGVLVEAARVKQQLHSFGVEVRVAMQGIPDAIVDEILVEHDRTKIHKIIKKGVDDALNKLTEVVERDFTH